MRQPAYLETVRTVTDRKYNPKYGDDRVCECGHAYYRHFDSYEDMAPVGCKYCTCFEFSDRAQRLILTPKQEGV